MMIALVEGVGINTILGMSMIKPAKLSLSLENEVVTPGVLKYTPFPVTIKTAIRSVSNIVESGGRDLTVLINVTDYPHITEKCVNKCILSVFVALAEKPLKAEVTDHKLELA